jgi:hypothetical protein
MEIWQYFLLWVREITPSGIELLTFGFVALFYRNFLLVNKSLMLNSTPILFFCGICTQVRLSGDSLTNYVALLMFEVGQPWNIEYSLISGYTVFTKIRMLFLWYCNPARAMASSYHEVS